MHENNRKYSITLTEAKLKCFFIIIYWFDFSPKNDYLFCNRQSVLKNKNCVFYHLFVLCPSVSCVISLLQATPHHLAERGPEAGGTNSRRSQQEVGITS